MRIRPLLSTMLAATVLTAGAFVILAKEPAQAETKPAEVAVPAAGQDGKHIYSREEIEKIVKETIMNDPQIIIDSIQAMQERREHEERQQSQQAVEAYKTSLFEDAAAPTTGNPKGDVTVVEFFDYNCGYCKHAYPELLKLVEADKNVKVILLDYPVLAPSSETAARAALAMNALLPEKYYDYHGALFRLGGQFDKDNLASVAEGMGADKKAFLAKMDSPEIANQINKNRELASKLGARGVPLFVIGKEIFPGALDYNAIKEEVAKARNAALSNKPAAAAPNAAKVTK